MIYWLQVINWIVAGAITAILVLVGYFILKKYQQGKQEAEKKRAEMVARQTARAAARKNRNQTLDDGEADALGGLNEALAGIHMDSYPKPASTGRISRLGILGFFVITTFILVYLLLLILEQYIFMAN